MFVAEYDGWAGAMIINTYTIGSYNPIIHNPPYIYKLLIEKNNALYLCTE